MAYAYDGEGTRVWQQSVSGPGGAQTTTTTTYLLGHDEQTTTQPSRQQATVVATRYYPTPGGALAVRDATGLSFLATDHLGTPIATVNLDTGALLGEQLRAPYGEARYAVSANTPSGGMHTTFGFTGQREDTANGSSGLDYFNARYYDASVGRFTSGDTLVGADWALDGYAYVSGMVESATDPSGRVEDPEIPAGNGALATAPGSTGGDGPPSEGDKPPPPPPAINGATAFGILGFAALVLIADQFANDPFSPGNLRVPGRVEHHIETTSPADDPDIPGNQRGNPYHYPQPTGGPTPGPTSPGTGPTSPGPGGQPGPGGTPAPGGAGRPPEGPPIPPAVGGCGCDPEESYYTLWHGTDLPSALDIMENGINPAKLGKIGIFFTAEHDFVAQSFASATAGPTGELQALVETFMPAQVFETLQAQGHITEEPLNQYATVNEIRVHPGAFDAYDNSPKRLWKQEGNLLKPQDC